MQDQNNPTGGQPADPNMSNVNATMQPGAQAPVTTPDVAPTTGEGTAVTNEPVAPVQSENPVQTGGDVVSPVAPTADANAPQNGQQWPNMQGQTPTEGQNNGGQSSQGNGGM